MRPEKSLVVCTLPRSGSYLLCDGLGRTERLGFPAEYYSVAHNSYYERLVGAERARQYDIVFDYIMRIGVTPNGVFAAKILFHQLKTLRENFDLAGSYPGVAPLSILDRLLPDPRYIHLVRSDKLRQAISYYRAIGSGIWWTFDGGPNGTTRAPPYDYRAIAHWYRVMSVWETAWSELLKRVNGPVLTMTYDEVVADYPGAVARVHDFMGVPAGPEVAGLRPALQKQSDRTTDAWVRRFHEDEKAARVVPEQVRVLTAA